MSIEEMEMRLTDVQCPDHALEYVDGFMEHLFNAFNKGEKNVH